MRLTSEPLNNLLNRRKLIEPEHGPSIRFISLFLDDLYTPSVADVHGCRPSCCQDVAPIQSGRLYWGVKLLVSIVIEGR